MKSDAKITAEVVAQDCLRHLADSIEHAINTAIREEREKCAQVCERLSSEDHSKLRREAFDKAAAYIRDRAAAPDESEGRGP